MGHVPEPEGDAAHGDGDEAHAQGEDGDVAGLLQVGGVGGTLPGSAGVLDSSGLRDLGGRKGEKTGRDKETNES